MKKRIRFSRFTALICAMVLLALTVSGCGQKSGPEQSDAKEAVEAAEPGEAAPEEDAEQEPAASIAAELFDRYGDGILRFAFSHMHNLYDAEDVLQETLIRYLENKPKFADMRQEKCWMFKVAANVAKDMLRRRSRGDVNLDDHPELPAPSRERGDLLAALLALPEKYKTSMFLYYYEGYSVREIARAMGQPEGTVKSWLHRAREILRKDLEEDES